MDKKIQIVGASCIAPFVITLLGIALFNSLSLAILIAIFAVAAVYGVGVLLGKFPVPFLKVEPETEEEVGEEK